MDGLMARKSHSTKNPGCKNSHEAPEKRVVENQHAACGALIRAEAMTAAGMKAIEAAKADGRWEAAYASPRSAAPPEDFLQELSKNKKAEAFSRRSTKPMCMRLCIVWKRQRRRRPRETDEDDSCHDGARQSV